MEIEYNHDRPLSDFQDKIDIIKKAGFNPIGVSQMFLEDVFIFETNEEAKRAFKELEVEEVDDMCVVGWWHDKESFLKEAKEYQERNRMKVRVYWLK